MTPLAFAARHGRLVLVAGLAAGFAFPGLARVLAGYLPQMVILVMFLGALRLAPGETGSLLTGWPRALAAVLTLQLALPLGILALTWLGGWQSALPVLAMVLVASAPSIVGSPNISALMGLRADAAMQLLLMGTLLLPVTVMPIFWLMPALGSAETVLWAAVRLVGAILLAGGGALLVRTLFLPHPTVAQMRNLDGASVIGLAVFVIGLMPALSDTVLNEPQVFAFWLAVACVINLGPQILVYRGLKRRLGRRMAGPIALISGNRNLALFFAALPTDITTPLLVFLGCYQLPMFLTPILMHRLYAR